jgi:hypothetical protein
MFRRVARVPAGFDPFLAGAARRPFSRVAAPAAAPGSGPTSVASAGPHLAGNSADLLQPGASPAEAGCLLLNPRAGARGRQQLRTCATLWRDQTRHDRVDPHALRPKNRSGASLSLLSPPDGGGRGSGSPVHRGARHQQGAWWPTGRLERLEPRGDPMIVPIGDRRLVMAELVDQVAQHAQIVDRVDIAGDDLGERATRARSAGLFGSRVHADCVEA